MELGEADALRCVHDRLLRTIDLREEAGKDSPTSGSCTAPATGPGLWISTWVDYTTKYGLGYLLSNGAIGVYFNDSTKIVLASDGERFEYHERAVEGAEGALPHSQAHTLSSFPHDLTKKVTLLKHFRGYLVRAHQTACRVRGYWGRGARACALDRVMDGRKRRRGAVRSHACDCC